MSCTSWADFPRQRFCSIPPYRTARQERLSGNETGRARRGDERGNEMTQPKQTGTVPVPGMDPGSTYVTGLYNTPESANRAYDGLRTAHGYAAEDIDVVMSGATRDRYVEAGG